MGDFEGNKPAALKRAYYHRWGFRQHGGSGSAVLKKGDIDVFKSLKDTIKELGHEKLDVIDIFVSSINHRSLAYHLADGLNSVLKLQLN